MKAIYSKNVFYQGKLQPKVIIFNDGKIIDVQDHKEDFLKIKNSMNYNDLYILPGLIDPHVHINEPGRTSWEGFESATKSAAAGGITTIIDMPLNSSPATINAKNLAIKKEATLNKLFIDVGFWGGVTSDSMDQLDKLIQQDIFGIKCFMIDSCIDEFLPIKEDQLIPIMERLHEYNLPLLAHAEIDLHFQKNIDHTYKSFLASRPDEMELAAIEVLIQACQKTDCKTHIVHLATERALHILHSTKEFLPISVETAPHYLTFSAETIPDNATEYKCCPPIRSDKNKEALWGGLLNNIIDFIATDHSPCPIEMKLKHKGDFAKSWGGIASLQLSLPIIFTQSLQRRIHISNVIQWLAEKPSQFLGLENKKGFIQKNNDADFVIFDPTQLETVKAENLFHKNKITPYENMELQGKVVETFLRGESIYKNNQIQQKLGTTLQRTH